MTSPIDFPLAHRLLLAHLQAATSIATTFQHLPHYTTPTSSNNTTFSTSTATPPSTHQHCKPEPSPSHTPTPLHAPAQRPTPPNLPQAQPWQLSPQTARPAYSLHSSPNTPPPPPTPKQPLNRSNSHSPSPPYPDNGGWEPSDDEKLASLKLNKKARFSWKQIAKTLNKTEFDCKGRWKTVQILYTPQPLDATDPLPPSAAATLQPLTRDVATMTTTTHSPTDRATEAHEAQHPKQDP